MPKITKPLLIVTLIFLTALTSGCSLSTMTLIRGTAIYRLIREFDKEANKAASAAPKEEWRTVTLAASDGAGLSFDLPFDLEERQQLQPAEDFVAAADTAMHYDESLSVIALHGVLASEDDDLKVQDEFCLSVFEEPEKLSPQRQDLEVKHIRNREISHITYKITYQETPMIAEFAIYRLGADFWRILYLYPEGDKNAKRQTFISINSLDYKKVKKGGAQS